MADPKQQFCDALETAGAIKGTAAFLTSEQDDVVALAFGCPLATGIFDTVIGAHRRPVPRLGAVPPVAGVLLVPLRVQIVAAVSPKS